MARIVLTKQRMQAGVWEGRITAEGGGNIQPEVEVTHLETVVPGVEVREIEGGWSLRVPVPAETIADGVQTYLIQERGTGARLGSFAIVAGEPLEEDLRAEIDLLRAELDMLKRAFRRHCLETGV